MTLYCVEDPVHFVVWKIEMRYFIVISVTGMPGAFLPGGTKRILYLPGTYHLTQVGTSLLWKCLKNYPGEGEEVLSLRGHKQSGPSSHPPGPLGVCNPNEKQKSPPLTVATVFERSI